MTETMWSGRYLRALRDGTWEYAARTRDITAAVIVAVTDDDELVLVEQHRVPLGRRTIEMPAGLVADEDEGETLETAAARELEEETGYRAARIERLGEFASSPGMTSETFTLVRAHGLTRVGHGGGHEGEDITVHLVPRAEIGAFVAARRADGLAVDAKMLLLLAGALV
ncbi:NUDIX hydrolase [Sphingomonas corticis]|jgi:ADP-ribose pyrophosphatase|uniref:GDP-mannose pyrophosphatase n=1 Tax=Sphingomonas corticis TaxID=2722791 RepID=A0ABX1CME4_9SPHN|nr:NUDIX hydrolase [Sphingomonas corticis]NJR77270.1 NUDIX hydrolase [Sphingomonas corticis]